MTHPLITRQLDLTESGGVPGAVVEVKGDLSHAPKLRHENLLDDQNYLAEERAAIDDLHWRSRPLTLVERSGSDGLAQRDLIRAVVDGIGAAQPRVGLSPFHISPRRNAEDMGRWLLLEKEAHANKAFGLELEQLEAVKRRAMVWSRYMRGAYLQRSPDQVARDAGGTPTAVIATGGRVVGVTWKGAVQPGRAVALRGVVSGYTAAARRRFMRKIHGFDRRWLCDENGQLRRKPLFLTLTYPDQWPENPRVWDRHRDNFLKRLKRRFPTAFAFWRREFQRRGAPHYHLLVLNVDFIDYRWLAGAWAQVVAGCVSCRWDAGSSTWRRGSKCTCDEKHLLAGTEVDRVRTWQGVTAYASKGLAEVVPNELGKIRQAGAGYDTRTGEIMFGGRWWGVHNRGMIEWTEKWWMLTQKEAYQLRRVLCNYAARCDRDKVLTYAYKKRTIHKRKGVDRKVMRGGASRGRTVFLADHVGEKLLDCLARRAPDQHPLSGRYERGAEIASLRDRLAWYQIEQAGASGFLNTALIMQHIFLLRVCPGLAGRLQGVLCYVQ